MNINEKSIQKSIQNRGSEKYWKIMPKYQKKNRKWTPKGSQKSTKSADPRSGVLELFETGEVYLPLPPPPWALAAVAETCLHVSENVQAHVCTSGQNGPTQEKSCGVGLEWTLASFWNLNELVPTLRFFRVARRIGEPLHGPKHAKKYDFRW